MDDRITIYERDGRQYADLKATCSRCGVIERGFTSHLCNDIWGLFFDVRCWKVAPDDQILCPRCRRSWEHEQEPTPIPDAFLAARP